MPGFSVSGFRCERLLPNKEEKTEEAWEPVFTFVPFLSKRGRTGNSQGKVREFFGF